MLKKQIIKFVLIFSGLLIFFLIPVRPVNYFWADFYNKTGESVANIFIDSENPKRIVQNEIVESSSSNFIILIKVGNLEKKSDDGKLLSRVIRIDVRTFAWVPIAFLFSLIIATPLQWKRKLFSLFSGFLLMNVFIIFKMFLFVLSSENSDTAIIYFPKLITVMVKAFSNIFITQTGVGASLAISVLIWIVTTFRQSDYQKLKEKFQKNK